MLRSAAQWEGSSDDSWKPNLTTAKRQSAALTGLVWGEELYTKRHVKVNQHQLVVDKFLIICTKSCRRRWLASSNSQPRCPGVESHSCYFNWPCQWWRHWSLTFTLILSNCLPCWTFSFGFLHETLTFCAVCPETLMAALKSQHATALCDYALWNGRVMRSQSPRNRFNLIPLQIRRENH